MRDADTIVRRAADPNSSPEARCEAFGELVIRFQDMAFGCAFAVLGDAYLAQDTAQEAFVVAWQKLAQLREPAAFPGWLKRIVLSQCSRLTRCRRLQILPLEAGVNTSAGNPGPQSSAEQRDLVTRVLHAINALPENERLVTTLFYVNGYTQADIGEFLEVPVSTVNKRLYSARQRLKGRVVELFKGDLHQQRPSRNRNFFNELNTKIRPFHDPDWPTVRTIASARPGSDAGDYEVWLDRRLKRDAVFYKELKTEELYSNLSVVGEDHVREAEAYVILAKPVDGPVEKLFFDVKTGLLVRRYVESDTALGKLPLQTDYEDYREVDGVKQPFLIHWSLPGRNLGKKD